MDFSSLFFLIRNNPFFAIVLLLTLSVILVNGWTDAPNAIASCVATRCMEPRFAVLLAAFFNFLGVYIMTLVNSSVTETITKMINLRSDSHEGLVALSGAMAAIVIWSVAAWRFGIPTSESHALISGLTGSAIALHGSLGGVSSEEWLKVIIGLILSVFLGFLSGFLTCRLVAVIFSGISRKRSDSFFSKAEIFGAASMAFMHGAQDGQKFMGILLLATYMAEGYFPSMMTASGSIMLLCSAVMALGTAMGGKRIIKAIGSDMVKMEKYQGFSADIAASASLLACTLLSLPVSTTHVKTSAILGVGASKRLSSVKLSVLMDMALTWILTFPGCGIIGYAVTKLFIAVF